LVFKLSQKIRRILRFKQDKSHSWRKS